MSLTVQLTAKGKSQELWVECITEDTVYVGSNVEDPDYFYFIQAERRDANKLEVEPDVDMNQDFKCPMCGHSEEVEIPITVNFFWPES